MIGFVRDRTSELQRLADDVRRERDLHATDPAATTAASVEAPRLVVEVVVPTTTTEVGCDPCQPATTARHAA
jgi:hypothetical protein